MKNMLKFLGVITLAVIMGLAFIACKDDPEPEPAKKSSDAGLGTFTVKGVAATVSDKTGTVALYGNEAIDDDVISVVATAKHAKAKVTGITIGGTAYASGAKDVDITDEDEIVVNIEAEDGTKAAYTVTATVVNDYTLVAANVKGAKDFTNVKFILFDGAFQFFISADTDISSYTAVTKISYTDKGKFLYAFEEESSKLISYGSTELSGTGADMGLEITLEKVLTAVTGETSQDEILKGGKWGENVALISDFGEFDGDDFILVAGQGNKPDGETAEFTIAFGDDVDFTGKQIVIKGKGNGWWHGVDFVFGTDDGEVKMEATGKGFGAKWDNDANGGAGANILDGDTVTILVTDIVEIKDANFGKTEDFTALKGIIIKFCHVISEITIDDAPVSP